MNASDIGIIVTSWKGHVSLLPTCLKLLNEYDIALGWDDTTLPSNLYISNNVRLFISGNRLGLQKGETFQCKRGVEILDELGKTYFVKISGDVFITKPNKLSKLIENLSDVYDIGGVSGVGLNSKGFGTRFFFGKVKPFACIVENIVPQRMNGIINIVFMNELRRNGFKFLDMAHGDTDNEYLKSKDGWFSELGESIGLRFVELSHQKKKSSPIFKLPITYSSIDEVFSSIS
jgi:hypothetical protein